jgi:hypothetical protein
MFDVGETALLNSSEDRKDLYKFFPQIFYFTECEQKFREWRDAL